MIETETEFKHRPKMSNLMKGMKMAMATGAFFVATIFLLHTHNSLTKEKRLPFGIESSDYEEDGLSRVIHFYVGEDFSALSRSSNVTLSTVLSGEG